MKQLRVLKQQEACEPAGNWEKARDYFPDIEVNQETGTVKVTSYYTRGYQKKASIITDEVRVETKGNASFIRGQVTCKNWEKRKCSGSQKFCFAIFEGDSGHIYVHRAPASKGWMNAKPEEIKKRLRKLGIGADNVIQQGDFLLKSANGNVPTDDEFKHETMGSGHHKFVAPVLYCDKEGRRYYKITEAIMLTHYAGIDNIQHPDVMVPPGIYQVGTTATSLAHENWTD